MRTVGCARLERPSAAGNHVSAKSPSIPKTHRTVNRHTCHRRNGLIIEIEDAVCIGKHDFAGLGQCEPTALLAKQRLADALLKLVNLLADRRLRTANPFGRAVEAAQLVRSDQSPQHVHIQIDPDHRSVLQNCHVRAIQFS
jgi:hypothetical protein